MTTTSAEATLTALANRLRHSMGAAFATSRDAGSTLRDRQGLHAPDLWRVLAGVRKLRSARGLPAADVSRRLREIATYLAGHRPALIAILLAPADTLQAIHEQLADEAACTDDNWPATCWMAMCWLTESAWLALHSGTLATGNGDPQFTAADPHLLRPVAARQRFLLLTEPLRDGVRFFDDQYGDGFPGRVFGTGTLHDYLHRCREARWTWLGLLDEYQSHPWLAAHSRHLEDELDALLFRDAKHRSRLLVSCPKDNDQQTPSADDDAVVDAAVQRHLLPRYRVLRVARLSATARPRLAWSASTIVGAATATAIGLAVWAQFRYAALTAGLSYLLLGAGVVALGRGWAAQWLLRLPAAGAFGLLALVALHPDWWRSTRHWWLASLVLVLVSYGYLVVEARNHDVPPTAALGRAAGVTALGAAHALLVVLVGLVIVAPEYAEDGGTLATLWATDQAVKAWPVLLSGAAWCLAIGVFSQILWDDRPITAPLAHLHWRRGV